MKTLETLGNAVGILLLLIVYMLRGIVVIPFMLVYYVCAAAFTIAVFGVCAIIVLVYKGAAVLTR